MNHRELVLCVGMHRSGTSLTASLLQGLGLCLPGDLISADSANPSGYFENRSIVDAQEKLLQDLGYWWPTDRASYGMPASVVYQQVYIDFVDWLTNYLQGILKGDQSQIAIKDPRTSLLMPAWRQAAGRLGLSLKVVICVRDPRDVCWSLVCRDGPSVGMTWSRAQRLWMGHYKHLLRGLGDFPSCVVSYEYWLDIHLAKYQLKSLAKFLGIVCTDDQYQKALARIRPEFNHGGKDQLPLVCRSLRRAHASLVKPGIDSSGLARRVSRYAAALEVSRLFQAFRERLHVFFLFLPWGSRALEAALHSSTLREQLGTTSLRAYRRHFRNQSDLRPHPLISPAYLNRERSLRGLPPIQTADDLFRHLLYPDLMPLNTHPWFDCREYQIQTGQLGRHCVHPVLSFLRSTSPHNRTICTGSTFQVPWLIAVGAHLDRRNETYIPEVVSYLRPGLVLADPLLSLGHPSEGRDQLIANENYWREIDSLFKLWPDSDPEGPLTWISKQLYVEQVGLSESLPAAGYELWWVSGHWEAKLLASLAGVELSQAREFSHPQELFDELLRFRDNTSKNFNPVLIALTAPLLELFIAGSLHLPDGVGVLNLVWPTPTKQSFWLHLLAQAKLVVECRATVRAFFRKLGFKSEWPRLRSYYPVPYDPDAPTLILALESGEAEAQLAAVAPILNADSYDTFLRLDSEFQLRDPFVRLEEFALSHGCWIFLDSLRPAGDPKGFAVAAWAQQRGVLLRFLSDPPEEFWWSTLAK